MLALIVSNSGSLQDGLLALTTTIPHIRAVLIAENVDSALTMIENHQPTLIILEMSLYKVQVVIKQIKNKWAHIHLIVLVEDMKQKKEVEAFGINSVLIKGFPAQKLTAIVENFIDIQSEPSLEQTKPESRNKD